jgi:hypothetical protein
VSRSSGVPFVTDSAEEAHVLGVNFRIGGALPFLGLIGNEPGGCHVDLADIWGHWVSSSTTDSFMNLDQRIGFESWKALCCAGSLVENRTIQPCCSPCTRSGRLGPRRAHVRLRDKSD